MKKILAIMLAVVVLFSLTACGTQQSPSTATATQKPAQTLTLAHKGNPTGLNHLTVNAVSANSPITCMLYNTLLHYNNDKNDVEPELATEWKYIDDTHIQFTLRKDVVAHDGTKFTAKDVLYTLKTGQDSGKLTNYYQYFDIPNCKIVDDSTIIIAYKQVDPYALYNLSFIGALGIVVQDAVTKDGGTLAAQNKKPTAGTGPYKFVEWVDGSYVKLARNDKYWGPKPYYDFVIFKIITDASARIINLESGDCQIALDPPSSELTRFKNNNKYTVINEPTTNITTLYFNCTKAPFNDVKVRQAIALAIDYEADLKVAADGYGTTSDSFLPKSNIAYSKPDGSTPNYYHFDVEAAKKKLAESSVPKGFTFELVYSEGAVYDSYAQLLKNQLAAIGITLIPKPTASSGAQDLIAYGKCQAYMINSSNPNPGIQLNNFDHRYTFEKGQAGTGWEGTPELDKLMDQARTTVDKAKMKELYVKIQAIVNENCAGIPLYSPTKLCITTSNITGMAISLFSDMDPKNIHAKS